MFRMLPGKIGPARKILTYIKKEQQKSNDQQVLECRSPTTSEKSEEYRGIIVEEVHMEPKDNSTRNNY